MSIRIRIEHGQDAGKTVRLPRPGVYVLGRHTDSSMRIIDMKVSKAHAEVHVVENNGSTKAILRDLKSTHGSQVNGQPVSADTGLNPGDEIRLGLTILRVLSDGAADEDLAPAGNREVDQASVETRTKQTGSVDADSVKALPPDALVGKQLGGYKLEKKIGQGGMGAVYLAEQVSLHRKVALKVLSEKFVKDSAFVDQFLNEARAAGALNHPNVVQVYDVGEAQGHYYFSMEFVRDGSIEEKLKSGDAYSWEDALNWFLDATNALVFARKRDILHRDVKPDNLMLSEDGSAKLCDLGLAKRAENADLMSQGIIGTPHFISPEAIRRKTAVDHRTDLYSLGCTFFRILSGKNPYPGTTVKEILLGHLKKPVPHITDHNKDIPKQLDDIVFKLMQKDPDDRFETADELLTALDKVRVQHGLEAHGITPKSRKPIIIIAAIAILAAAGVGIWAANQEPTEVVVELTDKQKREIREAAIADASDRYEDAASDAKSALLDLKTEGSEFVVEHGKVDLYKVPAYAALAGKFETFAADWTNDTNDWAKEKDAQEFDEVKQVIDTAIAEVTGYVEEATTAANDIREEIRDRKSREKEEAESKAEGAKMAEDAVKAHAEKCKQLLADGKDDAQSYVDLALALRQEVLDDLVKPGLERAIVSGVELLDYEKDMVPLLEKYIKKDLWLKQALRELRSGWTNMSTKLRNILKPGGQKTPELYEQAIELLTKYLETMPESPDAESGDIAKTIRENRTAAAALVTQYETDRDHLIYSALLHDRDLYFDLIRAIRAPGATSVGQKSGLWSTFSFDPAIARARNVLEKLKTEHYKPLVEMWIRDTEALAGLFQHLKEAFPWDERNLQWTEIQNGKDVTVKYRPQKAELDHLLDSKNASRAERLDYAQRGPKFVLDVVMHDADENARIPFTDADKRGLALLAEMAGDIDAAGLYWQAYKTSLAPDAPEQRGVAHHMKMLADEEIAAGWYYRVKDLSKKIRDKIGAVRSAKDWRQKAFEVERELNVWVGEAQEAKDKLTSADLAHTVWASSLRETPHKTTTYAGPSIPSSYFDKKPTDPDKAPGKPK